MSQIPDIGQSDPDRVDIFFKEFRTPTGYPFWEQDKRSQKLDERIRNAGLSLADKIKVFKMLSPSANLTDVREELRMERLILSISLADLPRFKFALEYDGDYKDMVEYIFHDIDKSKYQKRIIEHFRKGGQQIGIKVLTDVDDTMYANLIDARYPKKSPDPHPYPGVLEFYDALKREPFALTSIPITALSARPGILNIEEGSLRGLVKLSGGRLCPSTLSGEIVSSLAGTIGTLVRNKLGINSLDREEDEIGFVKFKNFLSFSEVYPEYSYVFVGDSGQADALTARLMVAEDLDLPKETPRAITTFIHDIRESLSDERAASSSFRSLPPDILVSKTSKTGRGVIVFRNYIEAALVAHIHSETLDNLITLDGLARITRSALEQFQKIDSQNHNKEAFGKKLREQYREDAESSYKLLTLSQSRSATLEEHVSVIRRILDEEF